VGAAPPGAGSHGAADGAEVRRALQEKGGKNDGNDAEAICEAVTRPNMRFVPVKSAEQQALLALHRVRRGFIVERTASINRLRGLLSEFGVILPLRSVTVRRQAARAAEALPGLARRAIADLLEHLRLPDERIAAYEREIEAQARHSEPAQRLMKIRGIGATTALAIVATVGNGHEFRNGRRFAAWIGLTPRQHSTGGKPRLGHISKQGATPTFARCSFRAHARCCIRLPGTRTGSRAGRWRCSAGAATTARWSRSPTRTRASPGRCSPKTRRYARPEP
jgi:transposase